MKTDESMQQFISRVDDLAEQLTILDIEKVTDREKALVLTCGVPKTYRPVIIAMQEAGTLSDYKKVSNSLLNEELFQNEENNDTNLPDEKAFHSNAQDNHRSHYNRSNRGYRGNCGTYMNQGNHNNQYKQSDRNNQNQASTYFEGNCCFCNIYGHKEAECRKKKRSQRGNSNYHSNY